MKITKIIAATIIILLSNQAFAGDIPVSFIAGEYDLQGYAVDTSEY